MTLLEVRNVSKEFGEGENKVFALSGINFVVEEGEFLAIMGTSGRGKSTLLNCISTIDKPSSGDIYIDSFNLSKATENQLSDYRANNISYVFQNYNLISTLNVYENIVLPLQIRGERVSDDKYNVDSIMNDLGIESLKNKFPDQLSGGQRQRVAIARALVDRAKLLIADEPTGALDSVNSERLLEIFSAINRDRGVTIIMVTHDSNAAKYSSRVILLKDGRIQNNLERKNKSQEEYLNSIYKLTRSE